MSVNSRSRILVDSTIYHIAKVSDGPCGDPLQGAWRKDPRSTDADRELQICKELKAKNRETMIAGERPDFGAVTIHMSAGQAVAAHGHGAIRNIAAERVDDKFASIGEVGYGPCRSSVRI